MPIATDLDRVRLLIGDTDSDDPLLSDEEIEEFITQRTIATSVNVAAAAADAAGAVAALFSRGYDFGEDGQNFARSQRAGHYQELEKQLRKRAGGFSVTVPIAGTETI